MSKQTAVTTQTIGVPDIGTDEAVDVIEIPVAVGDTIKPEDTLIVLESDKASMEVPSPAAGKIVEIKVKIGDKVKQGSPILVIETAAIEAAETKSAAADSKPAETKKTESTTVEQEKPKAAAPSEKSAATTEKPSAKEKSVENKSESTAAAPSAGSSAPSTITPVNGDVYAGPAVRKYARELGIDLTRVKGSGPKNRIQHEDLKVFIKNLIENRGSTVAGSGIPPIPEIDFAKFGEIEVQALTKLNKLTATNMHRSWLNLPHVTQFDDADITELEDFRASLKEESDKRGIKITPLPFLLKACAIALKAHPKFNAALLNDGEHIAFKKYVHIGIAVDTPAGLVVPVVRNVDRKSIWELAAETAELSQKAKDRKLKPEEMQGGCFTISSLGNIGGTGFTPIINAPEVAILAVSKLAVKPIWNGKEFVPRKMLPLSLSYDHRVVNGADAGRFFTFLTELLGDIRRLVL